MALLQLPQWGVGAVVILTVRLLYSGGVTPEKILELTASAPRVMTTQASFTTPWALISVPLDSHFKSSEVSRELGQSGERAVTGVVIFIHNTIFLFTFNSHFDCQSPSRDIE